MRHCAISLVKRAVINGLYLIIGQPGMRFNEGAVDGKRLSLTIFINDDVGDHRRAVFMRAKRT